MAGLKVSKTDPFDLVLRPGWNMIANPFDKDIRHGDNVLIQVKVQTDTNLNFEDITGTALTDQFFYEFTPPSNGGTAGTV